MHWLKGKKAVDAEKAAQAESKNAPIVSIDFVLEDIDELARFFGGQVMEYSLKERKNGKPKVAGFLNFKEALEPLLNRVPKTMPVLCEAWNDFVTKAVAYDCASDYTLISSVNDAFDKIFAELEAYDAKRNAQPQLAVVAPSVPLQLAIVEESAPSAQLAIVEQNAPSKLTVAKNNVVNAGVAVKNAIVANPIKSGTVAAAAVAAPVVAKTGLIGKAIAWYNNIGNNRAVNNAVNDNATNAAVGTAKYLYNASKPLFAKAGTVLSNHKGALIAGSALTGVIGGMHYYLDKDDATTVEQAPVNATP